MATLRTNEEKSAILAQCLKLEREGGDILAYLWSQNYLTPRATWFNYQREWLGRKPYQYTDGKPKKRKEKKTMATMTDEIREAAINAAMAGGSPCAVLKAAGFKNPASTWSNIKTSLAKTRPEVLEKLPKRAGKGEKLAEDVTVVRPMKLEPGANYELKAGDKLEITQVLQYHVTAIDTEYGEFYNDRKFDCIDWRNAEGDEVSLKVESWKKLAKELPTILDALGVDV